MVYFLVMWCGCFSCDNSKKWSQMQLLNDMCMCVCVCVCVWKLSLRHVCYTSSSINRALKTQLPSKYFQPWKRQFTCAKIVFFSFLLCICDINHVIKLYWGFLVESEPIGWHFRLVISDLIQASILSVCDVAALFVWLCILYALLFLFGNRVWCFAVMYG